MVKSHRSSLFHQWPERFSTHLHLQHHQGAERERDKTPEPGPGHPSPLIITSPTDSPTQSDPFGSQILHLETISIRSPPHSRPTTIVSPTFSAYSHNTTRTSSTGSSFSSEPYGGIVPCVAADTPTSGHGRPGGGGGGTTSPVSGSATTPKIILASPSTSTIHYLFPSSDTRTALNSIARGGVAHLNPSSAKEITRSASVRTSSSNPSITTRHRNARTSAHQLDRESAAERKIIENAFPLPPSRSAGSIVDAASGGSIGSTPTPLTPIGLSRRAVSGSASKQVENRAVPAQTTRVVKRQPSLTGSGGKKVPKADKLRRKESIILEEIVDRRERRGREYDASVSDLVSCVTDRPILIIDQTNHPGRASITLISKTEISKGEGSQLQRKASSTRLHLTTDTDAHRTSAPLSVPRVPQTRAKSSTSSHH